MAKIEFYVDGADKHIAVLNDGAVPRVGDAVNILKRTYYVQRVTWAVDDGYRYGEKILRANVELSSLPLDANSEIPR